MVPRAAKALFKRLSSPPPLNRNGSSALRAPARYSVSSLQNLQSPPRPASEQQWQMKVTYVEVLHLHRQTRRLFADMTRFITNGYVISWCLKTYHLESEVQFLYEKIKDEFSSLGFTRLRSLQSKTSSRLSTLDLQSAKPMRLQSTPNHRAPMLCLASISFSARIKVNHGPS